MDVYVNEQIVPLFPGSISVNDGETVQLTENNVATVSVPQNGEIRIVTAGFENDIGYEPLPIIAPILETEIPFDQYTARAQAVVADYVLAEANDLQGFVEKRYTAAENFGVGQHSDCSEPNDFATSPQGFLDTKCDFRLDYRIEEVQ